MDPATNLPGLRVLQLIVAALILGVVIFGVIAATVAPVGGSPPANASTLSTVVLIAMPVGIVTAIALRVMLLGGIRRDETNPFASGDGSKPAERAMAEQRFTVATILSAAMLEGVALLGVVLYMMTGSTTDLAVAAMPVVFMAFSFPTEGRWRRLVG